MYGGFALLPHSLLRWRFNKIVSDVKDSLPYSSLCLLANYNFLIKFNIAMVALTCTLRAISSITGWTGSTCISTSIGWRGEISAVNACVTRLSIHLAGVDITITESSCVSSLTCAAHVNKLAVSVDLVALFWWHTLATMIAGAHVDRWTPSCARSFLVGSNEGQIELKTEKNLFTF